VTYIVDTHSLIWLLETNRRLSSKACEALKDKAARMVIPTIVLAEIAFLAARRRTDIDLPQVFAHIAGAANCVIYPFDETVLAHLPTTLEIHDGIIVATALMFREAGPEAVSVVTKDKEITASGLVDVIW
jgi:PIN domain nuclease of toxin-antitoxin system